MKFNKQILKKNHIDGLTNKTLIETLKAKISYLMLHNKNMTQTQFCEIRDLKEIIEALEA